MNRIVIPLACAAGLLGPTLLTRPTADKPPTLEGHRLAGFLVALEHLKTKLHLKPSQTKLENYRVTFFEHDKRAYAYRFQTRVDPDETSNSTDGFISRHGLNGTICVSRKDLKVVSVWTD